MSEESEKTSSPSPTDSLTRPSALIPHGSPIKFRDISDIGRRIASQSQEDDENGYHYHHKTGGIMSCSPIDIPECLTPTLEDHNLSEMLVMVANQDKDYVGCNMLSQLTNDGDESEGTIPKLVGQTPSPVMSPFWFGDDISRDGPGGDKKITSPGTKKASMSLGLAEKRLFVINNGRVVEDGAKPARYHHQGTVLELVPGQTPVMKPDDYVDAGSSITEILLSGNNEEKAYLESGFCARLVLFYEDPDKPRLVAMSTKELLEKLATLQKNKQSPSAEHFTPVINISRDAAGSQEYTTALYFTTKEYTYFIYVEKANLVLKKYATGDTDPSANPRNNKQFADRPDTTNCSQFTTCGAKGFSVGKDETDSSDHTAKPDSAGETKTRTEVISGGDVDSANGSSNSGSGSSSQLSSPESGSGINPSTTKVLNNSVNQDSGVEANSID